MKVIENIEDEDFLEYDISLKMMGVARGHRVHAYALAGYCGALCWRLSSN